MSKPSLTGREQQQSSPFGLGHKQAKKAKKYGAFAPYLHHIPKNRVQMRRTCTIFFGGVLNMQEVKIVGRGVDTLIINVCYANERFQPIKQELEMGRSPLDVQQQMGHTTLTMTNHYASLTERTRRKPLGFNPGGEAGFSGLQPFHAFNKCVIVGQMRTGGKEQVGQWHPPRP